MEKIRTKEELVSEYYRSALFGKNKKRRSVETISKDILALCGAEESKAILAEQDAKVAKLKAIADKAVEMARNGIKADSLELENLLLEATGIGNNEGCQYVLTAFQNADLQVAPVPEQASTKMTPTKEQAPAKETSTAKKKPQVISGEDFFTGNAFIPEMPKADGTFPDDWHACNYTTETQDFGQLMYKYCYCGLWEQGQSRNAAMQKIVNDLRGLFSDDERIDNALKVAEAWLKRAIPLMKEAKKRQADTPEQKRVLREVAGPLSSSIWYARKKEEEHKKKGKAAKQHTVKITAAVQTPKPAAPGSRQNANVPSMSRNGASFTSYPSHQNDIFNLKPAKEWNLYIDESGADENFVTNGSGVIAGALSDASHPLPAQPQLHVATDATEEKLTAGDKVIETLLNHGQCGVLAIPASAYTSAQGWGSLIASFIDLVLRLLPLQSAPQKVKLNVFVEGRAPYINNVDFNFIKDACCYNLMHVFPERANRIVLSIQAMGKNDTHNAYPDIISNTCAQGRYSSQGLPGQRFQASGWNGSCFLNYKAAELRNILEYFFSGRNLPAAEWEGLLNANGTSEAGLLSAILKTIGTEAQNKVAIWKEYLDWTVAHLSSKAINLRRLHLQLSWLKRHQPAEAELPPRIKLLWLTSKLAESNHLGEIESQSPVGQEFMRLVEELYEEDAPLVCWAVLHLAVQKTNAYQFEEAKKLVTDFSDIGGLISKEPPFTRIVKNIVKKLTGEKEPQNYVPAAIPGLRYYGQLLSSCGQHEAFLGDNEKATIYFKEAIRCFERLSENKALDIDQTSAYLATAQMDMAPNSKETIEVMRQYLGADIIEAAKKLAVSDEDKDKYHHHILLRYLVQSQNKEAIDAYLKAKGSWKVGEGHPWEMIEFYRALLLDDKQERLERIMNAYNIAVSQKGDTLRIIACVILGAAKYFNAAMPTDKLQEDIEYVVQRVPALGQTRISALKKQLTSPMQPMELAGIVLPFNFR